VAPSFINVPVEGPAPTASRKKLQPEHGLSSTQVAGKLARHNAGERSAYSGPATTLAFHDLVTLLQQALALTILALLLLLDVGAFFVRHCDIQTSAPEWRT
jgi:hypothetical protein